MFRIGFVWRRHCARIQIFQVITTIPFQTFQCTHWLAISFSGILSSFLVRRKRLYTLPSFIPGPKKGVSLFLYYPLIFRCPSIRRILVASQKGPVTCLLQPFFFRKQDHLLLFQRQVINTLPWLGTDDVLFDDSLAHNGISTPNPVFLQDPFQVHILPYRRFIRCFLIGFGFHPCLPG